jgi:hypothetical protein
MPTETRSAKRQHAGVAILDQLADLDVREISPETAQTLLKLQFNDSHYKRFDLLTAKAREASLTLSEQEELDEYIQTQMSRRSCSRRPARHLETRARLMCDWSPRWLMNWKSVFGRVPS